MARYNPYTSGKISLTGVQRIDNSAGRESVRMANTIAQQASQIAQFAFSRYEKQAIAEAKKRGATNPEQTLKQFEGKTPTSSADIAQFDSALTISAGNVEVNTLKEIAKAVSDAEINKTNPSDLAKTLDAIRLGSVNAISKLDPIVGQNLNFSLSKTANNNFISYSNSFAKEEQEKLATLAIENTETKVQLLEQQTALLLNTKDFDAKLKTDIDEIKAYYFANNVSPSNITTKVLAYKERIHKARIRNEFRKSTNKQKYLEKFTNDNGQSISRGISDADRKSMTGEMNAELSRIDSANSSLINNLSKKVKDIGKTLSQGLEIGSSLDDIERLIEPLSNNDNKIELQNEIKELKAISPILTNFRNLDIPGMTKQIAFLQDAIENDNNVSAVEREILEDVKKIKKDRETFIKPLETDITELTEIFSEGMKPNKEFMDDVRARVIQSNEPSLVEKFDNMVALYETTEVIEALPLVQGKKLLDKINQQIRQNGVTPDEKKQIEILKKVQSNKKEQLKKDPVAFYQNTNNNTFVDFPEIDMEMMLSNTNETQQDKQINNTITNRINYMEAVANKNGTPFKILSNEEIEFIENKLESGNNAEDVNTLRMIGNRFGDNSTDIWEQYFSDGKGVKAKEYAHMGLLSSINPKAVNEALNGFEVIENKDFKFDIGEGSDFTRHAVNHLNRMGLPTDDRSAVISVATAIYIQRESKQGKSGTALTFRRKKFEEIVNEVVGGVDNTGGFFEYNDVQTILPPGLSKDGLDDLLDNATKEEFELSLLTTDGLPTVAYFESNNEYKPFTDYEDSIQGNIHLQLYKPHKGLYSVSLDPEGQQTLYGKNGQPVIFDIRKLADVRTARIDDLRQTETIENRKKEIQQMEKKIMENYTIKTPYASGKPIIQTAVNFVTNIMPGSNIENTRLQMMEIASAESIFATQKGTFSSYSTGPFQFDDGPETAFATIQNRLKNEPGGTLSKNVKKIEDAINQEYPEINFKVSELKWEDMNKPLHSAVMLRLFMAMSPEPIGNTVEERAAWWKKNWNTEAGKGTVEHYTKEATNL